MKVLNISAVCTQGKLKGEVFVAKPNRSGKFVLNIKAKPSDNTRTNFASNKVYVDSLCEAWALLQHDEHLINLVGPGGVRALRKLTSVDVATS